MFKDLTRKGILIFVHLFFIFSISSIFFVVDVLNSTDYTPNYYSDDVYPRSPQSGDIVDKSGTAHNLWNDVYNPSGPTRSVLRNDGLGFKGNVEVSTDAWTFIPDVSSVNERTRIWLDLYDTNNYNMLLNMTTDQLLLPPTDQGLTVIPESVPWELDISSGVYLLGIVLGTEKENIFISELK